MKSILFLLYILISFISYSQDLIIKLDSSKIFCEIIKEDSSTIYYKGKKDNNIVEQSINRSEVLNYSNSKVLVQSQIRKMDSIAKTKPKFKNDSLFYSDKNKFKYHEIHFGNHKALILMENNVEAHLEMKRAITDNLFNILSTSVAISTLAAFAADAVVTGKPKFELVGTGVAFSALAFAFKYFYHKHSYKAVDIYNSNLKIVGAKKSKLEFGIASKGIGVCWKF